jgi:intein-encoded DNA endonuclease-like protein
LRAHEDSIVRQFQEQVDAVYSSLLKQLEKSKPDLQEISREYQQALSQDFFQSKLGLLVREKLTSKRGERS